MMSDTVSRLAIIGSSILLVFSMAGQVVLLPLFIDSFDRDNHHANPFFVLIFSSFSFALMFCAMAVYRTYKYNSPFFAPGKIHYRFLQIGILNALNGLLVVNASPGKRTPADLQAILAQSALPFTFLLSKLIKSEKLKSNQLYGVSIVCLGIFLSLIPVFVSLGNGEIGNFTLTNLLWCIIFLLGNLPAAACNVYQDKLLKDEPVEVIQTLAWSSIYQFLMMLSMFWLNFLPWFGTAGSYTEWTNEMSFSFNCFFSQCTNSWYLGSLFISAYILTYITSGILLKYMSANYTILLNSLSMPCAVTFWILFPQLNDMTISSLSITMDYISLFIVIAGIIYYVRDKNNSEVPYQAISEEKLIITP